MHIMLFGGAFDPPHLDHFKIVKNILEQKIADQVCFVPVKKHNFLKKMSPASDRLAMLQLGIKIFFSDHYQRKIKINKFELAQKTTNYSYKTLEFLSQKYPEHNFSFLIGSDNLADFHKWHDYQKLINKYQIYVYPRENYAFKPVYNQMIFLKNFNKLKISSTQIRDLIKAKKNIKNLVTKNIKKYILQNNLYVN